MKNTQRHDAVVSRPPRMSPMAMPEPATAEKMPSAWLRRGPSSKLVAISDSVPGAASAAPAPWTARAAISQAAVVASPPASDAAVKIVIPMTNTRRRPKMSPARPPSSSRPPKGSR
jgi:hypothetical protein